MNLAVGVIIGGAFTAIVTSLVNDVIMPFVTMFTGNSMEHIVIELNGESVISIGKFIAAIINFLIIAFIVFLMVKGLSALQRKKPEPKAPECRCPFCKSEVHKEATRCPHCTSEIEASS